MRTKKTIRLPFALMGLFSVSIAFGQTTYVEGPIEKESADLAHITVLGQTYVIDEETLFVADGKEILGLEGRRALQFGVVVAIESVLRSSPQKASLVVVTGAQYAAGATPVSIRGIVEQLGLEYGTLKVGGLTVDISATAPDALSGIEVGSLVEIFGTQPSPQGLLLGQAFFVRKPQSFDGAGTSRSLQSISGTGSSVSAQSISGTGSSVSAQSISGTGRSASVQSISGTGSSVSVQSISGTGSSASVQSISGTGSSASVQSISGTGSSVSAQSISGTGSSASVQSISGTGTSTT